MSQKVVKYLTTHNHVRIKRAAFKFTSSKLGRVLGDCHHSQEIIQVWKAHVDRFSGYTRRLVYTCSCIQKIVGFLEDAFISAEVLAIWHEFVFETLCRVHTFDHMQWLVERKNRKLWASFIESVNAYLHFLPQSLPVDWTRLYFHPLFVWHAETCRLLAAHYMHSSIQQFGDYLSFLTYRLPDKTLVLGNESVPVMFNWAEIPERCWSVMLTSSVNFFVSAFNFVGEKNSDPMLTRKVKHFVETDGERMIRFFIYLRDRMIERAFLQENDELKTLLKIIEIFSVCCCLSDETTCMWILSRCWQETYDLQRFWYELFQLCVDEEIDDSIILFTLLSVMNKKVGKDMMSVLLCHLNEQRMARILNARFRTYGITYEDEVPKEVNNALAGRLPEFVVNQVGKSIFEMISETGLYADDIEDIIKRWGQGEVIRKVKSFKKRKSNFLECGKSLQPIGSCCICCRDDRNMFICAPCGHVFCVVCGPLCQEKCHLCKEIVHCHVNKIYTNAD